MADILDEVAEDLRRERYLRLWQRYGWMLGVAALLLVVGVGGWRAWQWIDQGRREAAAERFLAASRAADPAGEQVATPRDPAAARASFEALASDAPGGYATLARFRAASLAADAGDRAKAMALWRQVAEDSAADGLLRDLARLALVRAQLPDGDPAVLAALLAPLAQPGAPFRPAALELQALLAERQGDRTEALARLRELGDDATAPASLRARAGELAARLGG